jgi:uncharacterized coiled-coil protein SlyX
VLKHLPFLELQNGHIANLNDTVVRLSKEVRSYKTQNDVLTDRVNALEEENKLASSFSLFS